MIDKLQERINRGRHAARILEDEGINQILTELGNDWTQQAMINAHQQHLDVPVSYLRRVVVLDEIRSKLKALAANGREAERELEKMQPNK
jgi:hypothetical protein